MPVVCLLPRAAVWHHLDACCHLGLDLPIFLLLGLVPSWLPAIRCRSVGCDANISDRFCDMPGHGVFVHWLLYHTCVVHRPCIPFYVPRLLALLRRTMADQLMLSAVHGASHQSVKIMRPKFLPCLCQWKQLQGYLLPDWLQQNCFRLSECSIAGWPAYLHLTKRSRRSQLTWGPHWN